MEASLSASVLDSPRCAVVGQLIARMKAEGFQTDLGGEPLSRDCVESSLLPSHTASVYLAIAHEIAALECQHAWSRPNTAQNAIDAVRAVRQVFLAAASCLMRWTSVQQCVHSQGPFGAFVGNAIVQLVDLGHGWDTGSSNPTPGAEELPWPSDWVCRAAAAIHSVFHVGRPPAQSFISFLHSKSSLQYSNSASGVSGGIGTGGTFFSADVSLQGFRPTTSGSSPPSLDMPVQPRPLLEELFYQTFCMYEYWWPPRRPKYAP